jgi:hypothetical protein
VRAHSIGKNKKTHHLRTMTLWGCALASVFVFAIAAGLGERGSFAQSAQSLSGDGAQTSQERVSPATADASTANPSGGTGAPTPLQVQQGKSESRDVVTDLKKQQIAEDSANLLKLASSLKSEVDKTTVDTVSITAIRQADEIVKLAHKMRKK